MNTLILHTRNAIVSIVLVCSLGCNKAPVTYPQRKDIIETVYASGKIVSGNEYKVSSLISGTIVKKLVKDGDTILKGQLLYIISHDAAKERFNAALKNYHVVSTNLSEQSPLLNDLK